MRSESKFSSLARWAIVSYVTLAGALADTTAFPSYRMQTAVIPGAGQIRFAAKAGGDVFLFNSLSPSGFFLRPFLFGPQGQWTMEPPEDVSLVEGQLANAAGWVVGTCVWAIDGKRHAFLWRSGESGEAAFQILSQGILGATRPDGYKVKNCTPRAFNDAGTVLCEITEDKSNAPRRNLYAIVTIDPAGGLTWQFHHVGKIDEFKGAVLDGAGNFAVCYKDDSGAVFLQAGLAGASTLTPLIPLPAAGISKAKIYGLGSGGIVYGRFTTAWENYVPFAQDLQHPGNASYYREIPVPLDPGTSGLGDPEIASWTSTGDVIGNADLGYVWSATNTGGSGTDIPTLINFGCRYAEAHAITDNGIILGTGSHGGQLQRLVHNGVETRRLNDITQAPPGLCLVSADAMSGTGIVAGVGRRRGMQVACLLLPQLDSDGDGMSDAWETEVGLNPGDAVDAAADPDGDTLPNSAEFRAYSNPFSPDTDGDSIPDAWELAHHLDPADATDRDADFDGDQLSNFQEYQQNTEPLTPLSASVVPLLWEASGLNSDPNNMPISQSDYWFANIALNNQAALGKLEWRPLDASVPAQYDLSEWWYWNLPTPPDTTGYPIFAHSAWMPYCDPLMLGAGLLGWDGSACLWISMAYGSQSFGGYLPSGVAPVAMNASGALLAAADVNHYVIYGNDYVIYGTNEVLDFPPGTLTAEYLALNDSFHTLVNATWQDAGENIHTSAFIRTAPGSFIQIQHPASDYVIGLRLANDDSVLGYYLDPMSGALRGFIWQNGTVQDVDLSDSIVLSFNNQGRLLRQVGDRVIYTCHGRELEIMDMVRGALPAGDELLTLSHMNDQGGFLGLIDTIQGSAAQHGGMVIPAYIKINDDANANGIPDDWETWAQITGSSSYNPHSADHDGDGISDWDEFNLHRTLAADADSDGDGFFDGHEIYAGSDPIKPASSPQNSGSQKDLPPDGDADGDGVENARELKDGTNPQAVDSDLDGFADNQDAVPLDRDLAFSKVPATGYLPIPLGKGFPIRVNNQNMVLRISPESSGHSYFPNHVFVWKDGSEQQVLSPEGQEDLYFVAQNFNFGNSVMPRLLPAEGSPGLIGQSMMMADMNEAGDVIATLSTPNTEIDAVTREFFRPILWRYPSGANQPGTGQSAEWMPLPADFLAGGEVYSYPAIPPEALQTADEFYFDSQVAALFFGSSNTVKGVVTGHLAGLAWTSEDSRPAQGEPNYRNYLFAGVANWSVPAHGSIGSVGPPSVENSGRITYEAIPQDNNSVQQQRRSPVAQGRGVDASISIGYHDSWTRTFWREYPSDLGCLSHWGVTKGIINQDDGDYEYHVSVGGNDRMIHLDQRTAFGPEEHAALLMRCVAKFDLVNDPSQRLVAGGCLPRRSVLKVAEPQLALWLIPGTGGDAQPKVLRPSQRKSQEPYLGSVHGANRRGELICHLSGDNLGGRLWQNGVAHRLRDRIVSGASAVPAGAPPDLELYPLDINDHGIITACTMDYGPSPAAFLLLPIDLDADSDNNNALTLPDRSIEEESVQFSAAEDPQKPGKILMVHDGDLDKDRVPDYADGLSDLFQSDGLRGTECLNQAGALAPIVFSIPDGLRNSIWVRFHYQASNPSAMTRTVGADGVPHYQHDDKPLRIWRRNTTAFRSVASVANGGDFVPDNIPLLVSDLIAADGKGQDAVANAVVLYVESLLPSQTIGDQRIWIEIAFKDGAAPPSAESAWHPGDTLMFSTVNLVLKQLGGDGSVQDAAGNLALSHPSPVIEIATCDIEPTDNGLMNVHLVATVTSAVCDTIPGDKGKIKEVSFYLNGADEPFAVEQDGGGKYAATKSADADSLAKPFPFQGQIDAYFTLSGVDGNNIISIRARDSVYQIDGQTDYAFENSVPDGFDYPGSDGAGSPPPGGGGSGGGSPGNPGTQGGLIVGTVDLSAGLSDSALDSVLAQVAYVATSGAAFNSGTVELVETATASGVFQDAAQTFTVALAPTTYPPDDTKVQVIPVSFVLPGAGISVQTWCGESAADTDVFVGTVVRWTFGNNQALDVGQGAVVFKTKGGEFHPYLWESLGPPALIDAIKEMSLTTATGGGEGAASASVPVQLIKKQVAGEDRHFLKALDGDAAGIVSFRWSGGDELDDLDDETDKIASQEQARKYWPDSWADFGTGFVAGATKGGIDMVGSLWDTVKVVGKAVAYSAEASAYVITSPFRAAFKWATTDASIDQVLVAEMDNFPKPDPQLTEMVQKMKELASLGAEMVEALLTGDWDKLSEVSKPLQDMVMMAPELIEALINEVGAASDYDKGYYVGRGAVEILAAIIPWGRIVKAANSILGKADFLAELRQKSKFFKEGEGAAAMSQTLELEEKLRTTKMCFVAGTPVKTKDGIKPIEQIRAGEWVLSRSEITREQRCRKVLNTVVTHPARVYHLRYTARAPHRQSATSRAGAAGGESSDGDRSSGPADRPVPGGFIESLTCSGPHPFFVVNRSQPGFVAAADLRAGDVFSLADGGTAELTETWTESAAPDTTFTTYNFEVEDFHTYFVGEAGVWVHNAGRGAPCEKVLSIYTRHRNRGLEPWEAFKETVQKTRGVPSQTFGLAAGEAMDEIYRLAAGGGNVTVPTYKMVRDLMKGRNVQFDPKIIPAGSYLATIDLQDAAGIWKKLSLESHHGAPQKLQEWLGISEEVWNDSPAYLTSFLEHRGKQVGIHQALADELGFALTGTRPTGISDAQLVQKLRDAYSRIGLEDFGNIAVNWLETQL